MIWKIRGACKCKNNRVYIIRLRQTKTQVILINSFKIKGGIKLKQRYQIKLTYAKNNATTWTLIVQFFYLEKQQDRVR